MKTPFLRWLVAGSICGFAACQKIRQTEAVPEEGPKIVTRAPAPQTATAAATPQDLAPDGIFYLARPASLETEDGIIGFRPGMRLVKQADGTYLGNGYKLKLQPNQVTNDLRVAQRVIAADHATNDALRRLRYQNAAAQAKARQESVESSSAVDAGSPRVSDGGSSSVPSTSLQGSGLESGARVGSGSFGKTGDSKRWHRKLDGTLVYE